MFKFTKILTVVTMIVAMAVPALANFSGSHTVLSGETWAADGDIAKDSNTDITINVGGSMTGGEFQASDGWGYTFDMDIFGAADITEFKIYGAGACTIVVGNGTDAATLTIVEGLLGKKGDASITIKSGGTMIITGNPADLGWDDFYRIDSAALGTDSYIDLEGSGTLKVADHVDTTGYEDSIKGNGVLDNWVKSAETIDGTDYHVYTVVALVPAGTLIVVQ